MSVGLKRGTVKLVSRHRAWRRVFLAERRCLRRAFGRTILDVEHVGSTAIPGVPAKPIIDAAVGAKSLAVAKKMTRTFARLGYEYRGKQGVAGRELFVKGPPERRVVHAHVTRIKGPDWHDLIQFRDFLRSHSSAAAHYGRLKRRLARRYAKHRPRYTAGKANLISGVLRNARTSKPSARRVVSERRPGRITF